MQQPTKLVIFVGTFFMLLFTTSAAFSKMLTKIFQDNKGGVIAPVYLAVNYLFFLLGLLLSPGVQVKCKRLFILSAIGFTINYSSGVFLTAFVLPQWLKYTIFICCGMISGFVGSFLWPSLGSYIHLICEKYNKKEEKGRYYGIFYGMNYVQNISSALLIIFVLGFLGALPYFLAIIGIAICTVLFGVFFIKQIDQEGQKQNSQQKYSLIKTLKNIALFYPKIKWIIPVMIIEGLSLSFINFTSFHLIPVGQDGKISNIETGICFLFEGFGAILGGYTGGIVCDKFSVRLTGNLNAILLKVSIALSIAALYLKSFYMTYIAFVSWGYILAYNNSWLFVIISQHFNGKKQAFAISKQIHCISIIAYNVVSIVTNNQIDPKFLLLGLCILSIPIYFGVSVLNKQINTKLKEKSESKGEVNDDENSQDFDNRMSLLTESSLEEDQSKKNVD